MSFGVVVLVAIVSTARTYIRYRRTRAALLQSNPDLTAGDLVSAARYKVASDLVRYFYAICAFCFEVVIVKSISALFCVGTADGEWRLLAELDQV